MGTDIGSAAPAPKDHHGTGPAWLAGVRGVQWAVVLAAGVALVNPAWSGRSAVTLTCAVAVILTAVSFAGSGLASRRPGPAPGGHHTAAIFLLAAACAGAALVVIVHTTWVITGETSSAGSAGAGWATNGGLAAANLVQALAVWLLLQDRSPRWAPSTGWNGPVVALGAAALASGALELATALAGNSEMPAPAMVLVLTGIIQFVVALTAVAVAAPAPRPQLRWLAAGITILVTADLGALAARNTPALLIPDLRFAPLWVRILPLLSVAGYAVLAFSNTAGLAGRRIDRRLRRDPAAGPFSAATALVACSAVVLAITLFRPGAPRAAAVLALACLLVALNRTRRPLRAVASRGRGDVRPRTDDLTGLANRRALSEALAGDGGLASDDANDSNWSGWAGWADEIALLLVDLDRFKEVNEALGHASGDRLLAEVGARLRTALRPAQLLARLGGDEFAVVLPAAGEQTGRRVAQALRESLTDPFEIDGTRLHVQASIGVATCHPGGGDPTDLLRQADVAMYQAKALGTGIEVYDEARDDAGGLRLRRTDELRDALERGDLEVHIQPQVDLHTGLICGAEALARWRHPVDGVLLPHSFLPLAAHTGLMRPVAALLLDRALEACATWWTQGFPVPVSVNVGADDLRDGDLPERVAKLLQRYGLPPEALCVEITEQALLTDLPAAAALLARWRADGIGVSIDDFGTGYSSLSYLRELPVDEIKLDQAFITDIDRPTTLTIVRHTVAMAHGLWARTVAEGIEDEATARTVTDLGCDVGQGLYFGAALTVPEFVARLAGLR